MKATIQVKMEYYPDNDESVVWYARIDTWVWGAGPTPQEALENLRAACLENFQWELEV